MAVMLYFRESAKMEAAYGFSITIAMLMTTILMFYYMKFVKKWLLPVITCILLVFLAVEISFFIANIAKIRQRWMFLIFEIGLIGVMYTWYQARKIKNRYVEFVRLESYLPMLHSLSNDLSVSKYATHLVYLTSADNSKEIEHKIIYSILSGKPKRADIYWFVHVHTMDEPHTSEYTVKQIVPNEVIRVELQLGFRVSPRTNLMFKKVLGEMIRNQEIEVDVKYERLQRTTPVGDVQFVVLEKFLSGDNELPFFEKMIMNFYFRIKEKSLSEEKGFGLDQSNVTVEKFPLLISPVNPVSLKRKNAVTEQTI